MAVTFTNSGIVKLKAGASVSTAITDAQYTELINEAEAALSIEAKIPAYELVANYGNLNANIKKILDDGASSHAAVAAIAHDPASYSKIGEAAFIANVNWTRYLNVVRLLKEKQYTDWIKSIAV